VGREGSRIAWLDLREEGYKVCGIVSAALLFPWVCFAQNLDCRSNQEFVEDLVLSSDSALVFWHTLLQQPTVWVGTW